MKFKSNYAPGPTDVRENVRLALAKKQITLILIKNSSTITMRYAKRWAGSWVLQMKYCYLPEKEFWLWKLPVRA